MSYVEQMQEKLAQKGDLRELGDPCYILGFVTCLSIRLDLVNKSSTFLLEALIGLEVKRLHLWFSSAAVCSLN